MVSINKIAAFSVALLLFMGTGQISYGQDYSYEDAAEEYTEAMEYMEANDFENAIQGFISAHEIALQVGEQAEEIINRASEQITRASLQQLQYLANQREWEQAINWVDRVKELDTDYGDGSATQRVEQNEPRLYYSWGNDHFRNEENEEAIEKYEQALELNENFVGAHYQLGLAHRRLGDLETSLEHIDRSMELAEQQGDQDSYERGRAQARDYLIYRGSEATDDERFDEAEEYLTRAQEYDAESARLHYRLAELYNQTERFSEALEYANTALEYEDGGTSDLARIYFEIGVAQQGLGNESEACDAFINAAHGDYRSAAEHELEHELNCDGWEEEVGR